MFFLFWPFRLLFGIVSALLGLLVMATCLLTIAAVFAGTAWLWSLLTHFRVQYLAVQLIALVWRSVGFLMPSRRAFPLPLSWWSLTGLMLCVGLNLYAIWPYYFPPASPQANSTSVPRLRLLHVNLLGPINRNVPAVIRLLRETRPDLLDFVEYTSYWRRTLERSGALKPYPYRLSASGHAALYSRFPILSGKIRFPTPNHVPNQAYLTARLKLPSRPSLTVVVGHPASPLTPRHWQWQRELFAAWIRERPRWTSPLIIVGDLNTAPWSPEFTHLLRGTGLRDSQLGFGLQPSWPAFWPDTRGNRHLSPWMLPLGLPIDHVLISSGVQVLSRQTGPFVGSDHLPVLAELAFPR
jgi:endonuclease/exonuclease/phosphatase (EEP) superfamily protein YafD